MRSVFTSWRSVAVLTAAQSLFQTASILLVTLSGLIGLSLAPDRALATLPLSAMIVGAALVMVPASLLMQRWGRRRGFLLGTACGVAAGVLGGLSLLCWPMAWWVPGRPSRNSTALRRPRRRPRASKVGPSPG